MKTDKIKELVTKDIPIEEEIIGIFRATYSPSLYWLLIIGPMAFLGNRDYIIVITDKHIHLNRIDFFFDDIEAKDIFNYNEISNLTLEKNLVTQNLLINFNNERILKLKAYLPKKKKKKDNLLISNEVLDFLASEDRHYV